jgi:hypothetical protein
MHGGRAMRHDWGACCAARCQSRRRPSDPYGCAAAVAVQACLAPGASGCSSLAREGLQPGSARCPADAAARGSGSDASPVPAGQGLSHGGSARGRHRAAYVAAQRTLTTNV